MNLFYLLYLRLNKLMVVLRNASLRRAFFQHFVLAGVEHKAVLNRKLGTVVDIGANRGQFALAARAFSRAKVISFEPLPIIAAIYRKVMAADPLIKIYVAAIGEISEKKVIHLSARDDSSSLLEITDAQSEHFPGTQEIGTQNVDVGPLSLYLDINEISRPAMLKLDVQGFEMQALVGCQSMLHTFDYIYCECSFIELYKNQKLAGEVIIYLASFGFSLTGVYNSSYDRYGNCIQADFLFEQSP